MPTAGVGAQQRLSTRRGERATATATHRSTREESAAMRMTGVSGWRRAVMQAGDRGTANPQREDAADRELRRAGAGPKPQPCPGARTRSGANAAAPSSPGRSSSPRAGSDPHANSPGQHEGREHRRETA